MRNSVTRFMTAMVLFPSMGVLAQTAVLPKAVLSFRSTLYAEIAKQAQAYDAALLPLAEDYVLELRKLSKRLKEVKDGAGQEAVRKEAARFMTALASEPDPFETVPELTEEVVKGSSEAVSLVQRDYIAKRTIANRTRMEQACGLIEKCVAALEQAQGVASDPQVGAALKKEATRMRVILQRKDAANVLYKEAKVNYRLMPPVPDVANLKERMTTSPAAADTANLSALSLNQLSPTVQMFLTQPLDYDKDWPPEVTKWKYETSGNYSHDFALYRTAGLPDEFGMFVFPKTMRAYVKGTKRGASFNVDGKNITWVGKAMSWLLVDSRDLVCKVSVSTKRPALKPESGPAVCVAVYSVSENNKLIASMTVPMVTELTELRMAKHFSYNRMNIVWEGTRRKRGFTIPDHMPMRVIVGIVGYYPGEEADATIEIKACPQIGDMW